MGMYGDFRSDPTLEQGGIVLDYGAFRVTVARAGGSNKSFQKLMEQKARPYQRAIQAGAFDNERAGELLRDVYASTIIKDWETRFPAAVEGEYEWKQGIEGPDGALLPFTKENVLKTFVALPDLFTDIVEQAGKAALYRASLREAAGGN